ncbi:hypothetical protein GO730_38865 [Spirosoma sp. HMF3257]|uniref:Uncharacterized protein n=1 Tax=Spirosoma telluris TaxID=2183553 RepID=A0A327ND30_9BACT|nr:hypothetical protein [Spirosoma telluris]RAI72865.1 hypothetical protein HMF3257_38795 [Spirosoma telluris]
MNCPIYLPSQSGSATGGRDQGRAVEGSRPKTLALARPTNLPQSRRLRMGPIEQLIPDTIPVALWY